MMEQMTMIIHSANEAVLTKLWFIFLYGNDINFCSSFIMIICKLSFWWKCMFYVMSDIYIMIF